ncbi:MAG: dipeptide/oligopeptide/nickel ABC transporter ATP-binding protein [Pseudomonadota bacterium]|uniref:ABC transporter ATP-binding protein n=1 Tax=Phenylobacterium sp. TaxID=1871053 RepID=UPI0025FB40AC|nr:dipeptide/oligopeptide/nickel ABC transporter ATP-binding protein [Phenylobacterium sp.]MBT9470536.1 ABC transporter ATP-binding protein [Phenylobacterium sp.]
MTQAPLAALQDVSVRYGAFQALRGVSLHVAPGEIVGLVGESGSGKTTAVRALMGLVPISEGRATFEGRDITHLAGGARRDLWRRMQMVFQDPGASLSPRMSLADIIAEPLRAHGVPKAGAMLRARELLSQVGLPADAADRPPTALSGGQRQRVAIARALALEPVLVVADEPMSALDVSVKAQIAALFLRLRASTGVSFVIVSHDLALMSQIADRIVVMRNGQVVEEGPARDVIAAPRDAYTRELRDACLDPVKVVATRALERAAS